MCAQFVRYLFSVVSLEKKNETILFRRHEKKELREEEEQEKSEQWKTRGSNCIHIDQWHRPASWRTPHTQNDQMGILFKADSPAIHISSALKPQTASYFFLLRMNERTPNGEQRKKENVSGVRCGRHSCLSSVESTKQ